LWVDILDRSSSDSPSSSAAVGGGKVGGAAEPERDVDEAFKRALKDCIVRDGFRDIGEGGAGGRRTDGAVEATAARCPTL